MYFDSFAKLSSETKSTQYISKTSAVVDKIL